MANGADDMQGVIDREGGQGGVEARLDRLQEAVAELSRFDRLAKDRPAELGTTSELQEARDVLVNSVQERAREISPIEMARALDQLPESERSDIATAWGNAQEGGQMDREREADRDSSRTD